MLRRAATTAHFYANSNSLGENAVHKTTIAVQSTRLQGRLKLSFINVCLEIIWLT